MYCDDIPSPPHCLYAAYVLSQEPKARIKGVDAGAALKSVGAVDFVSASDIPKGAENVGIFNPYTGGREPLFAEDLVEFVGQALGIVVISLNIFFFHSCYEFAFDFIHNPGSLHCICEFIFSMVGIHSRIGHRNAMHRILPTINLTMNAIPFEWIKLLPLAA